jgi:tetratricopeptide (TPR) repeat protein
VAWGYLATEAAEGGDATAAAAIAEDGWARAAPGVDGIHRLAVVRSLLALVRGDPELVLSTVERARAIDRERADYAYLRGKALDAVARREGDEQRRRALYEDAAGAYRDALAARGRVEIEHLVTEATERTVATCLGQALLRAGRGSEAAAAFDRALAAAR